MVLRAAPLLASLAFASPCVAFLEEPKALAPRPGVTDAFMVIRPDAAPVASVILFTGGEGVVGVGRFKNPEWRPGNFLVRNRRAFAAQGFVVAVVDVPSDHASGYGGFRATTECAQDVAAVIAALRRETAVPCGSSGRAWGRSRRRTRPRGSGT